MKLSQKGQEIFNARKLKETSDSMKESFDTPEEVVEVDEEEEGASKPLPKDTMEGYNKEKAKKISDSFTPEKDKSMTSTILRMMHYGTKGIGDTLDSGIKAVKEGFKPGKDPKDWLKTSKK